ncbi:MAG: hypothetical protein ACRDD1_10645 [Planctomycetia bacterium]
MSMVERVKCVECDRMILPETAAANGGLCKPCANIPEDMRRELREHESKVASGVWFAPSSEERGSAKQPVEFGDPTTTWIPNPEYYKDDAGLSAQEVIDRAAGQPEGDLFLVSNRGGLLSLAFNAAFGVCEYQNGETNDHKYAYSPENLAEQVGADRHLGNACRCCGVGVHWYPSRFHMPRRNAFAIVASLASGRSAAEAAAVEWLNCGDLSYTARGKG